NVFHQRENHSVRQVRRDIQMVGRHLFLAILPHGTDRNLTAANVDRHIHRMRERRPFLYMVVGYQLKVIALRKHRGLIVDRAILEPKSKARGDLFAADDLDEVARTNRTALLRTQHKKAMDSPFDVAYRNRLTPPIRLKQRRTDYCRECPASEALRRRSI